MTELWKSVLSKVYELCSQYGCSATHVLNAVPYLYAEEASLGEDAEVDAKMIATYAIREIEDRESELEHPNIDNSMILPGDVIVRELKNAMQFLNSSHPAFYVGNGVLVDFKQPYSLSKILPSAVRSVDSDAYIQARDMSTALARFDASKTDFPWSRLRLRADERPLTLNDFDLR